MVSDGVVFTRDQSDLVENALKGAAEKADEALVDLEECEGGGGGSGGSQRDNQLDKVKQRLKELGKDFDNLNKDALLIVEFKASAKFPIRHGQTTIETDPIAINHSALWKLKFAESRKSDEHGTCPIVQTYGYMLSARKRYGMLSTGHYTWFLERRKAETGTLRECNAWPTRGPPPTQEQVRQEQQQPSQSATNLPTASHNAAVQGATGATGAVEVNGHPVVANEVLLISKAFQCGDTRPSLAQAIAHMVGLAMAETGPMDPSEEVREHLLGFRSVGKGKRSGGGGGGGGARDGEDAEEGGDDAGHEAKGMGKREQQEQQQELPLEELNESFRPIEYYGHLNHGDAFRVNLHGHDSVIKVLDANKDRDGVDKFQHEADMYMHVKHLWGDAVPPMVFAGRLVGTRESIATGFAGRTLDSWVADKPGIPDAVKDGARRALRDLHAAGIVHGDVALRNIAVDDAGRVRFIDLGDARLAGPEDDEARDQEVEALERLLAAATS